jgi:hypothetical protein
MRLAPHEYSSLLCNSILLHSICKTALEYMWLLQRMCKASHECSSLSRMHV